ncbi:hypothetical protein NBRC10512_000480 [Rhodotorula toruloides]|uniref:NADH dehydrogenase [ubiquinone] 1 beta subcomplex subunit 11, mitochondrial n=2 Tax=Rhodotorula toruloides TaxID=5286 RepID=A0A061AWL8_RHOTO|nr:NADH-ubiquinone oxidoreductase [Rhodotorula toruloides NP11]EMS19246.1 NADH-ubiquinone oxidoreductase [Rhodotorula toruloides NP11]KAJ8293731.1 hypothetical protein OF846_003002 [Rhodotorula toruloides]KAK4335783.1 Complex I-ESSS [Rhodotorula toruloides]CDR39803.1 RHTO0S04e09780g1_1 [Rhodotorula toruloides]
MVASLVRSAASRRVSSAVRNAAQQQQRRSASGGIHFNEPSGRLFGEKPLKPGQKRVKEDWENIYYYGFGGTCLLTAIGLYYKRDTSIQTWARAEAMKKMEAEGTLPTYERS